MLCAKMPKVLIVGSGLTGSLVANLLRQHMIESAKQLQILVWDKAKGVGGRMSTSRSPHNSDCIADLGAQYISCTPHYGREHSKFYETLLSSGILEQLEVEVNNCRDSEPGTKHFVAPDGMNSIVKYFLKQSGCQTQFEHHITNISRKDNKWSVSTLDGKTDSFDAVVLTIPTPQILQLSGTIVDILEGSSDTKKKLESVQYSTRYALALYYDSNAVINLPFSVSYLKDDPVFCYTALDNLKRNRPECPPSVVLHTSVAFGMQHRDLTVSQAEPILKAALHRSFPDLPTPNFVKCHKWKFSQVTSPYANQPGVVQLSEEPLLLIGGDGLSHSNFDGCLSSAMKVVQLLSKEHQVMRA